MLIEAKNVFEQVAKVEKFTNKRVFVVNQNLICLAEGTNDEATTSEGTNNKISKHFNIDESNKKLFSVSRKLYCHCGWTNICLKNWVPSMLQSIQGMSIILI